MEFLPIYGLAYSSVKMADSDRARGLMAAINARLDDMVKRSQGIDLVGAELDIEFSRARCTLGMYDKTPELENDRSKEINEWLAMNRDVNAFVVIDDIKFGWYKLAPFVVNTDYRIGRGLEERHIEKAIKILLKAE